MYLDRKKDSLEAENIQSGEIINIKNYNGDIPKFSLLIKGLFQSKITDENFVILKIPIYEFTAIIENGEKIERNSYVGFKLKDLLNKANIINEYFVKVNNTNNPIEFRANEIADYTYLIFYKNGKKFDEENSLALLNIKEKKEDILEKIIEIEITDSSNFNPDSTIKDEPSNTTKENEESDDVTGPSFDPSIDENNTPKEPDKNLKPYLKER